MHTRKLGLRAPAWCVALGLAVWLGCGCGWIADKDRIKVAKIDGEYITRGDLFDIIYDMEDAERPTIRTKYDLERVLQQHIDNLIKVPLGEQLESEGKISVTRDYAREQYFMQSGDKAEQLRSIWNIEIPKDGDMTGLMRVYGLTPEAIQIQKDFIEQETDRVMGKMLGDRAVQYMAAQEAKAGRLEVKQDELRREYELQKDSLQKLERLVFRAIQIPINLPGAEKEAAQVRKRIDGGEDFEAVFDEYLQKGQQYVVESEIENNPALTRFKSFWATMAGASVGEIHGPLVLPDSQLDYESESGEIKSTVIPAQFLVLKVLEHEPARELTFEEAAPVLAQPLYISAMMDKLYEEHGVEIYEDKLPDPAGFTGDTGESVLDL